MVGTTPELLHQQLLTYKEKTNPTTPSNNTTSILDNKSYTTVSDIDFTIEGDMIIVREMTQTSKNDQAAEFFKASARKNASIVNDIRRNFSKYGL